MQTLSQTTAPAAAAAAPCERRITAARVRELCGGIADMTLWRWLADPEIGFPRPIYIGRRRYWREADVLAWLRAQEDAA